MATVTNEPVATGSERKGRAETNGNGIRGKIRNRAHDMHGRAGPRDETVISADPSVPSARSAPARPRTQRDVAGWLRGLGTRLHGCSPYADKPASIRDVVHYTAAGGWVPGDHPWYVESPGYAWGVLLAIPGVVVLNAAAWVIHKMGRAVVVGLALLVFWHFALLPPDLSWTAHSWRMFFFELYAVLIMLSLAMVLGSRKSVTNT